ncbi:hypothetical protein ICR95_20955 [Priestia megaterium]|uniref:Uncharacterized protein n=1 Tax=Priestia megaterium TaxID=1404 RepID=A0AAX6BDP4_PRIMG|nr:hypothetical protein [Priestia megaterium]QSF32539.1 hypothetical protein ICR95_20955 [Priestia megaterium]GMG71829.1 hypothetical protein ShirakiTB12_02970 [Priestia megaterium]
MRGINKDFTISVSTEIVKTATEESFSLIIENKESKFVNVEVVFKTSDGEILDRQAYQINDEKYDLLMADCPDFSPNKPSNEYREADLWYMIDLIRNA